MTFFHTEFSHEYIYAKLHNNRLKVHRFTIDFAHISKCPHVMPYLGVNVGEAAGMSHSHRRSQWSTEHRTPKLYFIYHISGLVGVRGPPLRTRRHMTKGRRTTKSIKFFQFHAISGKNWPNNSFSDPDIELVHPLGDILDSPPITFLT